MIGDLFVRLWLRLVRRIGAHTLLSLGLLLIVAGSAVLGLAESIRNLGAVQLMPVAVYGLLCGWLMARSRLKGWQAGIAGLTFGATALLVQVGRLGEALIAVFQSAARLASEAYSPERWLPGALPAFDFAPVEQAWARLGEEASVVLVRIRDWMQSLLAGQPAFDPVATALVWALAVWCLAAWAGWFVRRRDQAWVAVTPAAILLAIGLSISGVQPDTLLVLLGAALLLQAQRSHLARDRRWQIECIDSADFRLELSLSVIAVCGVLIVAAALAPSISVQRLVELAQSIFAPQAGSAPLVDSLGLKLRSGPVALLDQTRYGGLPRQHLIGSGPELSRQVVMWVSLDGYNPIPPQAITDPERQLPPRYYWRSVTYDQYTGRGWQTGATQTAEYEAGESALDADATPSGRTVRQTVQVAREQGGFLYATGELVAADQDYRVAWRAPGDAFGAQIDTNKYRADSRLPVLNESELRSAGVNYPAWVRDRYLALPGSVPARVRDLALDLTATEPAPYDRALAIERYLRSFPYTLDLPAPPPNRDVADYFLFDLQQGYCDYFATAMVALARAAGLPARLVTGFAGGYYDSLQARFVVTEADAHSWVEIYFPGHGWVEFEPASGRPPIDRAAEAGPIEPPESSLSPSSAAERTGAAPAGSWVWLVLLSMVVVLALIAVAKRLAGDWRLRRMPARAAVGVLYRGLYRQGRGLAVAAHAATTPYEFAGRLIARVIDLDRDGRYLAKRESLAKDIHWLVEPYVRGRYSPKAPDNADREQAIQAWRRLRNRLWLARFRAALPWRSQSK